VFLTVHVGMLMTELFGSNWVKLAHNNVREVPASSSADLLLHDGFDPPEEVAKDKSAHVAEIRVRGGEVLGGLAIRIGSRCTQRQLWLFVPGEQTSIIGARVGRW
jgi:hypothetical protein